jgi:hypothetical protein
MMRRMTAALVGFVVVGMVGSAGGLVTPARAAPPTVVPSPGYDARLQERRSAPMVEPPVTPAPIMRSPRKRGHHHHGTDRGSH